MRSGHQAIVRCLVLVRFGHYQQFVDVEVSLVVEDSNDVQVVLEGDQVRRELPYVLNALRELLREDVRRDLILLRTEIVVLLSK